VTQALYVVASKCLRNHFISYKYKTIQSLSYLSLKIGPHVRLNTSGSECKVFETFLEDIFENLFISSIAFLMVSVG